MLTCHLLTNQVKHSLMHIYDLDGKRVTITDLPEAIRQAGEFKEFRHEDPSFSEMDKKLQAYWSDIHTKLVALQKSL
jgi:signal transduction histidine kinase